ncbi:MAG TPA: NPCBM/NEW2 domain-containing protein [Tepidisphaeraceae bacterium]|nr:NPCBM/NEW2 domain-containing protein [Tepidisphaeraceae bacterium]
MLAAHILGSSTVYSTIQAAVDAAPAGATITVDAGSYAEEVTVYKSLTIDGAQAGVDARTNTRRAAAAAGNESVITGATGSSGVSSSFYVTANDVTIDGFTVQGSTAQYNYGGGIVMGPSIHGTHIVNDIIQNNFTGLLLSNNSTADPVLIQHDVFLNNTGAGNNGSRGIYSDGGVSGGLLTNVVIDSNAFIVNKLTSGGSWYEGCIALEALKAGAQQNITITNNSIDGVGKLLLYNCNNVTLEYNVMTHNMDQWSGVFRFEGGDTNVTIKYNTVYDNTGVAVTVDSKGYPAPDSGFVVEDNNFYNNNTAYGNKYSLGVTEGAYNGTFDASNNYWGSATGPGGQGGGGGDMAWGNGTYEGGANDGWGAVAGNELALTPYSATPIGTLDTPYWGVAANTGAPIQAEDFNQGGNGNGYYTTATSNAGGQYRTAEKVGIQATTDTGGGYNVGYTVAGEWLDYTFNAAAGGTYNLQIRIASAQTTGGKYHINIDGTNVTGTLTAPNTGGTQTWQTVTVSGINISAGTHVLRLALDSLGSGGYVANFNWLELVPVSVTAPPAAPTNLSAVAASATTVNLSWQESSTSQGGFVIQRSIDGVNFSQVATVGAASTTYSDTTAAAGTTYTYRVYATSSVGNSANSGVATVATPGISSAPTGLTAVATSSAQVNVSWTDTSPALETGFIIQRAVGTSTSFAQVGTTAKGVTTFSDTSVAGSTSYTYRVIATSAGGNSAASATASATTPAAGAISTNLSSLNWVSATTGWGSATKNLSVSGNPLTLNGVTYASGIGTHAVSNIVYNLAGGYTNFISDIGIDGEEKANGGAVDFQVIGDGKVLYDSGILTSTSATVSINVNVTGVQTMTLVATNGVAGSIDFDHADWAGARLLSSAAQPPAAPSNLVAVDSSPTQVNLTWTNNAPAASGFIIDREIAGSGSFTQIATTAAGVTTYFDTTAAAGISYVYQVLATNGSANSAASNSASATTLTASAVVTNLSTLPWVSATAGYGTVQLNSSISGNVITLRGVTYASGIGAHAVSNIVYNLAGNYTNFISDVGVDDEENGKGLGSVDFQVIGDGKVLFDSGVLTNNSQIVSINVNVTGVQTLTLLATNGVTNSIDYDHADWAGAKLVAAGAGTAGTAGVVEGVRPASTISALQIVDTAAPAIPTSWSNISIGNVGQLGGASETAGVFSVSGAGAGIGTNADALDYVYQTLAGNGTIVAHLDTAQSGTDEAGVLIREGTGAGAKEVGLIITNKGVKFVHRATTGGKAAASNAKSAIVPQWEKLVRKGNTFTAYDSVDGKHWKKIGSANVKMNAGVDVGLAADSGTTASLNVSLFSDVAVTG